MRLFFLVLLLLTATPALAAEPTRLALAETASREVSNDRVVALLEGRVEAPTPAAAQARLNETMAEALDIAEGADDIDVRTTGYSVRPIFHDDRVTQWVATQGLRLETASREALLTLAGRLQETGLAVEHLGGRLSDEAADALRDELMVEALEAMNARARLAATTLGLTFDGWEQVGLDGVRPLPRAPMMEARAMAADVGHATLPVMTETLTTVTVTVTGTGLLVR